MNRKIIIVIVLALAALIGWQVYKKASITAKKPRNHDTIAVAVEVTEVKKATISDVGVFTGTLLPDSQFIVAPKIAGRLEKILVNIGDDVKRGQLIAILDDAEFVQQADQARAEIEVTKANLEESRSSLVLAERQLSRSKALEKKKIVSQSELDNVEAVFRAALARQKVAEAQISQKEAALKASLVRLGYTRIRGSWQNGSEYRTVGERFVDEGAMLKINDPIATIIDIASLTAVIHVIERDYPRIRKGQSAIITADAYPERIFTGTISRIAPVLKEEARQARVELAIPNAGKLLKPGMFVRVRIEFDTHENATVVPISALTKNNGNQGVFMIDMNTMKARLVTVTPGIVSGDMVEIIDPVISGHVVTMGQHLLKDGISVKLPFMETKTRLQEKSTAENQK